MVFEEIYFVIRVVFSMTDYGYIERNLSELNEELKAISNRVGVEPPKLVSVTKSGSDEELLALASMGCIAIGENRPGELKRRSELLFENGFSPELHQIGTLQSNKAKLICDKATLIHSLDSVSLAKEIDKQGKKLGKKISVLIEVNSAEEPQKSGVLPNEAERFLLIKQRISRKNCHTVSINSPGCLTASAVLIIVHTGKIIMHKRIIMYHLQCCHKRLHNRSLTAKKFKAFLHQHGAKALSARKNTVVHSFQNCLLIAFLLRQILF